LQHVRVVTKATIALWSGCSGRRLAGLAMRGLYGTHYTDMCAFRAIRRDRLMELGM
jgi:hypothetical protein